MARTIPTFQLAELREGRNHHAFRRCLFEIGSFYLKDESGLPARHARAAAMANTFFATATDEEKRKVTTQDTSVRRGYSRLSSESTAKVTRSGEYPDYADAFSIGRTGNLFPSFEFEKVWTSIFDDFSALADFVARQVFAAVDCDIGCEINSFLDCNPLLRFRHYPDIPSEIANHSQPARMAPHYDLSIISVILQTPSANGFVSLRSEVDGEFVEVPALPGHHVVLCGAVAKLVSDGRIKAPQHLVAAPGVDRRVGSARDSSVFFLRPRNDFTFSVDRARACGLDISLRGATATFRDWMGRNYEEMAVPAES